MGPFNPFLAEFRRDPYRRYRELRERSPVYLHPVLRIWMLTRYRDAVAVLGDRSFSVDRTQAPLFHRLVPEKRLDPEFFQAVTRSLLMIDAPDHTRLRNLVSKAFTPRVVERLRPRIQQIVDELLDRAEMQPQMEFMSGFAYPLPVIVIAEMLGVPTEDHEKFKLWSDGVAAILDLLQAPDGIRTAEAAYREFAAYFREIIALRRREPRDDLISALAAVEERGDTLSEAELLAICVLILGAGHETTSNLLGNGLLALLQHPAERRRLQDEPTLVASAVEELLRWNSPVQITDRVATEDCEIDGQRVKRGQLVAMVLGSANRDPEQFPDPDRLDLGRIENRHLAFGWGPHFCLGAAVARAEAQIAFSTLLRRFPDFGGDPATATWRPSMVLRGLTRLPIKLGTTSRSSIAFS